MTVLMRCELANVRVHGARHVEQMGEPSIKRCTTAVSTFMS